MSYRQTSFRLSIFLLILFIFLTSGFASTPLKPLNGKNVTIRVGDKEHIYHLVTAAEPINLQVSGPVKLEIITRLALLSTISSKVKYSIKVTENGQQRKVYTTAAEKSAAFFTELKTVPAMKRKFTLNVPEGEHTFTFALQSDSAQEAALRFMLSGKHNLDRALHGKSVRLEPVSYDRIATAIVAEKLITYYVCSMQKGVQLHVIGPSQVVVDARLNYDAKMVGKQKYNMKIIEGTKTIANSSFSTTKSVGAYYQDWKEVIPGKINILKLIVPEGDHIYKFILDESIASSVSLKFSIPEKDVTNTKK